MLKYVIFVMCHFFLHSLLSFLLHLSQFYVQNGVKYNENEA